MLYEILLVNLNLILQGAFAVKVNLDLKGKIDTLYLTSLVLLDQVVSIEYVADLLITREYLEPE